MFPHLFYHLIKFDKIRDRKRRLSLKLLEYSYDCKEKYSSFAKKMRAKHRFSFVITE